MINELPSWNEGPTRQTILEFVARVTDPASPDFVAPESRIAAFDNDGTLWSERPFVQGGFIVAQLRAAAEADPTRRDEQPWRMAVEGDPSWMNEAIVKHYDGDDSDVSALLGGVARSFSGITVEEFCRQAADYFERERHPVYECSYLETAYAPMVELLDYLEAHAFSNYIVSGGGRDFMRPITERVYNVPPERVIGSASGVSFRVDERGAHLMRDSTVEFIDDGPQKPALIWDRTGRRPILTGGNANGDIPMFQFAGGEELPALRLLVHHDDDAREVAYDAGAGEALRMAEREEWTIVSMRDDWCRVFTFEQPTGDIASNRS